MKPPHFRHCRYEVDGQVVTIAIDRPEVLNALHPQGHQEIPDAFDRYVADDSLRVAIVTGSGNRAFRVGTDLKFLAETGLANKPGTRVLPPLSAGK